MKTRLFPVKKARAYLGALLKQAQTGQIVITNHGQPVAVIVGIEGASLEDLFNQGIEAILRAALMRQAPAASPSSDPPKEH